MAAGEMSEAAFTQFLMTSLKLLAHHSVDGALHYICIDTSKVLCPATKEIFSRYIQL
jgi:hypothetical protein